ncbi:helix-turn-helix transcriptional regulator [Actinoplanes missouriensis]|uniref:helix-turn-helix domain-containing protein n=1 Tax=Actinoplanes missouriensis TaxID=1866 RepID=UPI003689E444
MTVSVPPATRPACAVSCAAGASTAVPLPPAAAGADRWSRLTVTELAVVEKIAAGATNREVAAAMFLSPHTVNTHVRHAFTKLGITPASS